MKIDYSVTQQDLDKSKEPAPFTVQPKTGLSMQMIVNNKLNLQSAQQNQQMTEMTKSEGFGRTV